MESQDLLGAENRISCVLDCAYKYGMCSENKTIIDMVTDILTYDKGGLSEPFIDASQYLFNDSRYEYTEVYPVYDLSTGLYGLYNINTQQYIYKPNLPYLSSPDDQGYLCICYNGYYGCINMRGEKVIGFLYDEPITYYHDVAIVKTNEKYGVISPLGEDILQTKYGNIKVYDHVIAANTGTGNIGESEYETFALFSYSGKQLSQHCYCDIVISNDRIYVQYCKDGDIKLDGQYFETWYDLFDLEGNRLIGEGTALPEAWGVKMPGGKGIMIAICNGKITNEYNYSYPKHYMMDEYGFRYITDDLKWLNKNAYCDTYIGSFNDNGFAAASVYNPENQEVERVIIDSDGKQVDRFRLDDCNWYMPVEANHYIYKMSNYSSNAKEIQYAVCNRNTRELLLYPYVEMVEGTDLIIVQDNDTGLYGLYDGETLALELLYNEIEYDDNKISAKRGAETIEYVPQ